MRAAVLLLTVWLSAACSADDEPEIEFAQHTYTSGTFVVERPFAEVKAHLFELLAPFTAADAYARYDAGATRADFTRPSAEPSPRTSYTKCVGKSRFS